MSVNYFIMTDLGVQTFDPGAVSSIIVNALAAIAWLQNLYFLRRFGACDYSQMRIEGPYEVGMRHILTEKKGNEAMVFYPVDGGKNKQKLSTPLAKNREKAIKSY